MCDNNQITKDLLKRFKKLRKTTIDFTNNLDPEDMVIQTNEFVSPIKWHLAHTTWFFENFILKKKRNYKIFCKSFNYLFNSYYKQVGTYNPKLQRGFISRPYLNDIFKSNPQHHLGYMGSVSNLVLCFLSHLYTDFRHL